MKAQPNSADATVSIRDAEVVAWRRRQLLAAGFSVALSDDLARNCGIDLHALVELVERGCSAELAVRILAPFEHETRRC
jgi:hypothetical protein